MRILVTHPRKDSFDVNNIHFEKGLAVLDDQGTSHLLAGQQHEDVIKNLTDLGCTFKELDKKPAPPKEPAAKKVRATPRKKVIK